MARFEFGSGNLGKILALPKYVAGAIATRFVPRRPGHWVFGSGAGIGEGALVLHDYVRAHHPEIRCLWLAGSDEELRVAQAAGIDAVLKRGRDGWRATASAAVIVVTHGYGDVNRYAVRGGYVVQLWHGIPMKKLHLDSRQALRLPLLGSNALVRSIMAAAYRRAGRGLGLVTSSSPMAAERMRSALGVAGDNVAVTGDPRDDALARFAASPQAGMAGTGSALVRGLCGDEHSRATTILYAPTWRDGGRDPAVPTDSQWQEIARFLRDADATLLIRSHPLGDGNYDAGPACSDRIALCGNDVIHEITPHLTGIDVLITDYSSIAYDFSLLRRPIVFFAPDASQYAATRGTYEPWTEFAGPAATATWQQTVAALGSLLEDGTARTSNLTHTDRLRERAHSFRDGQSAQRVYEQIVLRCPAATGATP
ncbi:CDP-glycerol glycerophosphotransferase family protein [Rarobacter incanus]|uniref:CDP-glycerol glycerophosphotransferase family protein n=1 Tax=Rarobacter incanus TaxID=153494 RepID=UPI00147750C1|nr:CDP-glycerol glycerophosphotransferase family protein [Rarobacter incanus]